VNAITKANLKDDWEWGMVAYNRAHRPPVVSWRFIILIFFFGCALS
jgi:hypothetical protein